MYDGAKAHTAASSQQWLKKEKIDTLPSVTGMEWPSRSSDLNPIEQVWSIVESRVQKQWHPLTEEELRSAWVTELNALDQATVDKLVRSFKERLVSVVNAGGECTTPGR